MWSDLAWQLVGTLPDEKDCFTARELVWERIVLHPVPQVELFEFKGEDLTEEEDGGIIRRIRTRGEGYAKPNEGAIVEGETVQSGFQF